MRMIGRIVGFAWMSPMLIVVWALYIGPLWAWRYIEVDRVERWVVVFRLSRPGSYYQRVLWSNWLGWSGPACILYEPTGVTSLDERVITHEHRHCVQQLWFGVLFYPAYLLAGMWSRVRRGSFYFDNPFERDARRAAGER